MLPHFKPKSTTGPDSAELSGVRWTRTDFDEGSGVIVTVMFFTGKAGRALRIDGVFETLRTIPWKGVLLYITRDAKYFDAAPDGANLIECGGDS